MVAAPRLGISGEVNDTGFLFLGLWWAAASFSWSGFVFLASQLPMPIPRRTGATPAVSRHRDSSVYKVLLVLAVMGPGVVESQANSVEYCEGFFIEDCNAEFCCHWNNGKCWSNVGGEGSGPGVKPCPPALTPGITPTTFTCGVTLTAFTCVIALTAFTNVPPPSLTPGPVPDDCTGLKAPSGGAFGTCSSDGTLVHDGRCTATCSATLELLPMACLNGTITSPAQCCVSGTAWDGTDSSCTTCGTGTFDGDSDPSTPCEDCAAGRYSDVPGATECLETSCLSGSYSAPGSVSATDCTNCTAGRADLDHNPSTPCESCPDGTFSTANASTACADCETGQVSMPGSTNMLSCILPRWLAADGRTVLPGLSIGNEHVQLDTNEDSVSLYGGRFRGLSADSNNGGAIDASRLSAANVMIVSTVFESNVANMAGGGAVTIGEGFAYFNQCEFTSNQAVRDPRIPLKPSSFPSALFWRRCQSRVDLFFVVRTPPQTECTSCDVVSGGSGGLGHGLCLLGAAFPSGCVMCGGASRTLS